MAEPMKPTDVPRDLTLIAAAKLREWPRSGMGDEMAARRILAAVLPLVREQIAAEIEAHAESIGWYVDIDAWTDALDVIRQESWTQTGGADHA
jgi:uncharacterized protein (DUF2267 family)